MHLLKVKTSGTQARSDISQSSADLSNIIAYIAQYVETRVNVTKVPTHETFVYLQANVSIVSTDPLTYILVINNTIPVIYAHEHKTVLLSFFIRYKVKNTELVEFYRLRTYFAIKIQYYNIKSCNSCNLSIVSVRTKDMKNIC